MKKNIEEIKKFNRFYIRMMGLFNLYTDESPYSATEALILFEIYSIPSCTASYLSDYFLFDKGYISRILKKFEQNHVISRVPSKEDRRKQYLEITQTGKEDLDELMSKANLNVENMIKEISDKDLSELISSMKKIEKILTQNE
ncbi:MarR family winged helix-turn-helix transcriptional regulator [Oceanobacillus kapialis]|uniref:MarR family winged helix-turn-helix transcriptional regulator n=1 Tax=Oceanobacillus kapialis TaxID=481353 RepID=A0ABW5Q3D1_9BACI